MEPRCAARGAHDRVLYGLASHVPSGGRAHQVAALMGSELARVRAAEAVRDEPPRGQFIAPADRLAHERLIAYGVLTVMVVEDMDVSGYPPERFRVAVGGQSVLVHGCEFDPRSGRRRIDTAMGMVEIPSAGERAAGAPITVAGMAIPGA